MANRSEYTTVEVPIVLRDRLTERRIHPRQALYEIIEDALDFLDDVERPSRPDILPSNPSCAAAD